MDADLVQLSDRADVLFSQYGADATLANIRRSLTTQVAPASLAAVGKGLPHETKPPFVRTTTQTLSDGSVRSTTVNQTAQTIDRSQTLVAGVVTGGQVVTQTARVINTDGGNNQSTGEPLASTQRSERTISTVVADVAAGVRTETFTSAARITSSDSENLREETVSRVTDTRAVSIGNGRFIQQTVAEEYKSVTSSPDLVVQGAELRSSKTVTLVNLDTGEVTRTIQTSSSSATVKTQTTGTGDAASTVRTVSVRSDFRNLEARAGGAGDVTEVTENLSNEIATYQETTKSGATTRKLSLSATSSASVFAGTDQTVLSGSRSTKSESASLDSLGAYAATAAQRDSQFALAETGRRVRDGFDGTAPYDELPETSVTSASSLYRAASVSVKADGRVSVSAAEESESTQNGALLPPLAFKLSATLPAPIGGITPVPAISSPTANGRLTVQPSSNGRFSANALNAGGRGAVISANQPASQLTASDNSATSSPTANVNGAAGTLAAKRKSGATGASGAFTPSAQTTTLQATSTAATDSRAVALKADGAGNFYVKSGASRTFDPVGRLNLTV